MKDGFQRGEPDDDVECEITESVALVGCACGWVEQGRDTEEATARWEAHAAKRHRSRSS